MECEPAQAQTEESVVLTEEVISALRPSWPRIHLDVDLPGWFIILVAVIIGLRGQCPV
jgi:hypothetical protein